MIQTPVEVTAWDRDLLEMVARRNGIVPLMLVEGDSAYFAVAEGLGIVFVRLEVRNTQHAQLTDVRWCSVGWDELSIPARDAIQEQMAVLPLD